MEVSSQIHARLFTPGENPMYPFNRRLGGPQGQSGRFEEKKNLVLVPAIKPRIIQAIA
jgi:hypothetical protein